MGGNPKPSQPSQAKQAPKPVLPPDLAKQILETRGIAVQTQTQTQTTFSGPLPHPDILRAYNQIMPEASKRIFDMAQSAQDHQQQLQQFIVRRHFRAVQLGQIFAFIIGLAAMAAGTWLIYSGKTVAGLASFFGPITGLAGIYFYQKKRVPPALAKPNQPPPKA